MKNSQGRAVDIWLILGALVLSTLSLFVIASATKPLLPASSPYYFVYRQLAWIILAAVAVFFTIRFPYNWLKAVAPYAYSVAVVLLGIVLVMGRIKLGAERWISVGPFQLQPSEFAEVAVVLMLATYLDRQQPFS
ncbi:MAG: FtsW/RodA/SpoVE family cell cycle protein, partial [Firmicutes bacterium]|nr:FtsW/RodA/SpoVE family cell cycle protein [Bacillota bacterium]